MEVILYSDDIGDDGEPDDLEVEAIVEWDQDELRWVARFDPERLRHASDN